MVLIPGSIGMTFSTTYRMAPMTTKVISSEITVFYVKGIHNSRRLKGQKDTAPSKGSRGIKITSLWRMGSRSHDKRNRAGYEQIDQPSSSCFASLFAALVTDIAVVENLRFVRIHSNVAERTVEVSHTHLASGALQKYSTGPSFQIDSSVYSVQRKKRSFSLIPKQVSDARSKNDDPRRTDGVSDPRRSRSGIRDHANALLFADSGISTEYSHLSRC